MNRAVMLRMAACGIMGLGAALLVAALLLWTYTSSRITKIPLNVDVTLISDGTATALDPASLNSQKLVVKHRWLQWRSRVHGQGGRGAISILC